MILTVIFADTLRTRMAIVHENEHLDYSRRTVHVELTAEQVAQLQPRVIGTEYGKSVTEEIDRVFLEAKPCTTD